MRPLQSTSFKALGYGVDLMASTSDGSVGNQDLDDARMLPMVGSSWSVQLLPTALCTQPPAPVATSASITVQCSAAVVQVALFTGMWWDGDNPGLSTRARLQ